MTPAEAAAAEPFAFGGRLSLDLTWTLRYRNVLPTETLSTSAALIDWLTLAGLPTPASVTLQQLAAAVSLREAIYRAGLDTAGGRAPGLAEVRVINAAAARPDAFVQYDHGRSARRAADGESVTAALSTIARDAIEVLTADDGRLRHCAGDLCSLVFYDSSRPGTRRWCSAERCGNRASTRAHRERKRQS